MAPACSCCYLVHDYRKPAILLGRNVPGVTCSFQNQSKSNPWIVFTSKGMPVYHGWRWMCSTIFGVSLKTRSRDMSATVPTTNICTRLFNIWSHPWHCWGQRYQHFDNTAVSNEMSVTACPIFCVCAGDLSWLLCNADNFDAIVVDPRKTDHSKLQKKVLPRYYILSVFW